MSARPSRRAFALRWGALRPSRAAGQRSINLRTKAIALLGVVLAFPALGWAQSGPAAEPSRPARRTPGQPDGNRVLIKPAVKAAPAATPAAQGVKAGDA